MSWKGSWGGAGQQWGNAWGQGKGAGGKGVQATIIKKETLIKPTGPTGAKGGKGAAAAPAKVAPKIDIEALKAKVENLTAQFSSSESVTNTTLDTSKLVLENEKATVASCKTSIESLEKQQTKLKEILSTLEKELPEARRAGAAGGTCASDLTKSVGQCKALLQKVNLQMNKLKPKMTKIEKDAEMKAKEAKDTAAWKPILAKAKAEFTGVETAVSGVARQAAPLISKPDQEEGEELDKKIEAIQTSATEAIKKVEAARADIVEKQKGIKDYAPETKKTAQAALTELQSKIAEQNRACQVYKNLKKELPKLAENQKAVNEVTDKLGGHDSALTKAADIAKKDKLTKEQVKTIDENLEPVQAAVKEAKQIVFAKMKIADAATKPKFSALQTRCEDITKRIEATTTKIKAQRDVFKAEEAGTEAEAKLKVAEAAWDKCQDAEMPFLTGVEVLPEELSASAIKECTEAMAELSSALGSARSYIGAQSRDAKTYTKELKESTEEKLKPVQEKITALDGKASKFRKELQERKVAAALQPAVVAVEAFEKLVKAAEAAGKPLASKELEDEKKESVLDTIEKTKAAVSEATTKSADAKKTLGEKQKEAKTHQNHPVINSINSDLNGGQSKLQSLRNSCSNAEKMLKAKEAVASGEEKMKEAEAAAEKAKKAAPAEGAAMTMESVTALDEACKAAFSAIKDAGAVVQPHAGAAPTKTKAALTELLTRKTAAQGVVEKVKTDSKKAREAAITDSFVAEGKSKADAAEAAATKMDEAESPFLIGATMSLEDTQKHIAKCEEAAKEVRTTCSATTQYTQQKTGAAKHFGPDAQKSLREAFKELTDRVKKVETRLATFQKDTTERTKDMRMLEAEKMVEDYEAAAKAAVAAAEPFAKEGAESMSEADAAAPLKTFMEADKEAHVNLGKTRTFLGAREKDQKGNKEQTEAIVKLKERVTKAQEPVVEKKKLTAVHEKRSLATRLLTEAKEQVGGLAAEVKKVSDACAPLLEKGGEEFLIATSTSTLAAALKAHMKAKELTEEAVFKEAGKGKAMKEKDFVKYLSELPAAIEHDELSAFTDERRTAIFKKISADGKSLKDFSGLFTQKYTCTKPVTVTNKFEVEGAETVCKVELNAEVVLSGPTKESEDGQIRSECKVDDKSGWITIRQTKGASYLSVVKPFQSFSSGMEKAIASGSAAVGKVGGSLQSKIKQVSVGEEPRMKEAKEEMTKLKEEVDKAQKEIQTIKNNAAKAKNEYSIKERSELNAHIDARNAKEAAPFLEGPKAKIEALEADAKAADEAGEAMSKLSKDDLQTFAAPASTLEAVEKAAKAVAEKVSGVKEAVKEQEKAVAEVTPKTGGTALAQKELKAIIFKTDDLSRKASKLLAMLKSKCHALVQSKLDPTSEAIRKHAAEKKKTPEELFDSLKKDDKIPEEAFCKLVQSLGDASLQPEIAKLLCRKLEADGISKETFMKYVVIYYKVMKTIAYTDALDIQKCKTIRKGEEGEVVEVLEGPVHDESNGMTRIRARSTTKKPIIEGWITLSGSKGTAFLEKTVKPAAPAAEKE